MGSVGPSLSGGCELLMNIRIWSNYPEHNNGRRAYADAADVHDERFRLNRPQLCVPTCWFGVDSVDCGLHHG